MGQARQALLVALVTALGGCQWADGPAPDGGVGNPPGIYRVGSRIDDPNALGGFGRCDNYPKDLAGQAWGAKGAVSVVAFPDEPAAYGKHRGFTVRVVNRTGEPVPFAACDSALFLVREAREAGGKWREVESRPEPICGNSFHRVFLGPGQYWEFPAREYPGPIRARVRLRLDPGGGRPAIDSNEFDG
jgi:hypothetical protein